MISKKFYVLDLVHVLVHILDGSMNLWFLHLIRFLYLLQNTRL